MQLDLSDAQATALAQLLRRTIDFARYPLSPRLTPLRAILDKRDPPAPRPEPPPPLGTAGMRPSRGIKRRRAR